VLVLHVAYAFVPLGFFLMGAAIIWPAVFPSGAGLHAWMAGAVGLMTLAVTSAPAGMGSAPAPALASGAKESRASTAHVSRSQPFNLIRDLFDPLIEMCPILDEVSNDSDQAGRQHIGACGHDPWRLLAQEAMSLAHSNAVLKEKAAKLVDHCCPIADQA
jgi:NnrS protein